MDWSYKTTITKRSSFFFWYETKIRFQFWEKMLYIQYIYISAPSLSIRPIRNIAGKFSQLPLCRSIEIHPISSWRHFFLSGLSILWQYKGILSSKQKHKLKHTKAASTKPLVGSNLYFPTPSPFFRHRCTTAYICTYNITQVKYL